MHHYYDIYHLLEYPQVQSCVGTKEYDAHKQERFRRKDNQNISENEAFLMNTPDTLNSYSEQNELSGSLYYKGKPEFKGIIVRIKEWSSKL